MKCPSLLGRITDSIHIDKLNDLIQFSVSHNGTRNFCKHCGTHLFSVDKRNDSVIGIPIGVIKGSVPKPTGHYFVSDKALWYTIDDDLPQFGGDTGFVLIQSFESL